MNIDYSTEALTVSNTGNYHFRGKPYVEEYAVTHNGLTIGEVIVRHTNEPGELVESYILDPHVVDEGFLLGQFPTIPQAVEAIERAGGYR